MNRALMMDSYAEYRIGKFTSHISGTSTFHYVHKTSEPVTPPSEASLALSPQRQPSALSL